VLKKAFCQRFPHQPVHASIREQRLLIDRTREAADCVMFEIPTLNVSD